MRRYLEILKHTDVLCYLPIISTMLDGTPRTVSRFKKTVTVDAIDSARRCKIMAKLPMMRYGRHVGSDLK